MEKKHNQMNMKIYIYIKRLRIKNLYKFILKSSQLSLLLFIKKANARQNVNYFINNRSIIAIFIIRKTLQFSICLMQLRFEIPIHYY